MKLYLASLAVGVLVGALYGLLNVRSPAPPVIALVGLLGILIGEQGAAYVRARVAPSAAVTSRRQNDGGELVAMGRTAFSGERSAQVTARTTRRQASKEGEKESL